jgi:hypothetical protein
MGIEFKKPLLGGTENGSEKSWGLIKYKHP